MARPTKDGLSYFPLDVDFFEDPKIEALSGEFGCKGESFTLRLLCLIYRKGYWAVWDGLNRGSLCKRTGIEPGLAEEIVRRLVDWGFFDEYLFNTFSVLTSKGIQTRYFEAVSRRKHIDQEEQKYLLIGNCNEKDASKVVNVNINPHSTELMSTLTPQSKVNKSKVNKRTKGDISFLLPFDEDSPVMKRVRTVIVDSEVGDAVRDWVRTMYDAGKLTLTETSIERHLKDLMTLSTDPQRQLTLIDAAIKKEWKGFFPLTQKHANTKPDKGKSKIIQPGDKVGGWSWQNKEGSET
jgi:hypothetical protein